MKCTYSVTLRRIQIFSPIFRHLCGIVFWIMLMMLICFCVSPYTKYKEKHRIVSSHQ